MNTEITSPWPTESGAEPMSQERAEQLQHRIQGAAATAAQVEYEFLELIAEFDAGEGQRWYEGFRSLAHWVAYYCSMAPGTAREHVRVARALREMPRVSELMRAGRLSFSKARELTRLAGRVNEERMCELALEMTASQLARTVRAFRQAAGLRLAAEMQRCFKVHESEEGMTRISLTLPTEEAAEVVAALEKAARAEVAPDEGQPACRAEAMVGMARHYLSSTPTPAAEDDHHLVIVQVSAEVLAGMEPENVPAGTCHIEGSGPIEPATAQRLACDATVVPAVVGEGGHVLHLGRTRRTASRAQRRALRIRDGGCCQFPGCEQTRFLHAHHRIPWYAGGETNVEDLLFLCSRHHTALHEGGMSVSREGTRWVFRYRDGSEVCELRPPSPSRLAVTLLDDERIFPSQGGADFSLEYCVDAVFGMAA